MEKKFRVWDIEAKSFRNDCFLSCGGELFFNDAGRMGSLEQSKFVVQFATGLLDKNGKEIFEGDIDGRTGEVVTFRNGCFYLGAANVLGYQERNYGVEIIGNRFENPELEGK